MSKDAPRTFEALMSQLYAIPKDRHGRHRSDFVYRGLDVATWRLETSLQRLGPHYADVEEPLLRHFINIPPCRASPPRRSSTSSPSLDIMGRRPASSTGRPHRRSPSISLSATRAAMATTAPSGVSTSRSPRHASGEHPSHPEHGTGVRPVGRDARPCHDAGTLRQAQGARRFRLVLRTALAGRKNCQPGGDAFDHAGPSARLESISGETSHPLPQDHCSQAIEMGNPRQAGSRPGQ